MRHVDFSPLYRSTVGFDRLFSMLDNMGQPDQSAPAYPPYNIERTGEDEYRISMAVAGFSEADLEIESKENTLLIRGDQEKKEDEAKKKKKKKKKKDRTPRSTDVKQARPWAGQQKETIRTQ